MTRLLVALALVAALAQVSAATPYACDGLHVSPQLPSADPAVVAPWRPLAEAETLDAAWAVAVAAAALEVPRELSVEDRVRVQHELLTLARRTLGSEAPAPRLARAVALGVARRIAPTATELATLGDPEEPRVEAVLGPFAAVVQRATRTCGTGNSIHVAVFSGLLAFRPLRVGTTRALVAQLVAFDREGQPHETPLVDAIEIRLGDEVSAPACVVDAGDDGVLRPVALADLHSRPPFVMHAGAGVGCQGCHSGSNSMDARDIGGDELAHVDALRTHQVEELAAGMWQQLER